MSDDSVEPERGMGAGAQAVAAVVLVGGVVGGMWGLGEVLPKTTSQDSKPATCSASTDKTLPARYASPKALCTALNRADLPVLLGTPDEHAESASGSAGWMTLAGGTKIASPEADVDLETYSVRLSASYDDIPITEAARYVDSTSQVKTVLGHPAVLYSDRTIAISFSLGGGKASTGPGGIARSLLVSTSAKDGGDSFEISIWRQDDVPPDDEALFRIAEEVLPTVPGWTAG
ncbi:DUF6215 domain-containing protein [Streptomyces sp. NBC_01478]|uniref:DUF6215 domain-containing protein n=1 Tax=Streptomyces sp. NBC_01478 TaxID=2903882 RepID=UPI002E332DF8|nr:DUF6215 domain-containing protein [Streptomyces sp. NBC_01478]